MRPRSWFLALLFATLGLLTTFAQTPAEADPLAQLRDAVDKIQTKLQAGEMTPQALAPEIAEFDRLIASFRKDQPEHAALVLMTKISLYVQIFADAPAAEGMLKQLVTDFPQTKVGKDAIKLVAELEEQNRASATQSGLIGKTAPELNFTWSSRAGLRTLSELKGKVVVLDFWATWCGPCISSFPQVAEMVTHYAKSPVEIIGVTSLQGRVANLESQTIDTRSDPKKEMDLMPAFAKKHGVTWTVAFATQPVFNPEYGIEGIPYMAIIAPDGTVRHAGLHPGMPHEEKVAMIDAILKEFGLPVPAK